MTVPFFLRKPVWFKHGCTNCYPPKEEDETGSIRFDSLHLPLVGTFPKVNSLGWLNGNIRSFGLFNPSVSAHAKPAIQIEGNVRSTLHEFVVSKHSFVNSVDVLDSHTRVAVRRLDDRGSESKVVNLSTFLEERNDTPTEEHFRIVLHQ